MSTLTLNSEGECQSCAAPLSLCISDFGSSLRCSQCNSASVELRVESSLRVPVLQRRWDVQAKQELLPVTLAQDRESTALSKHKFEEYELLSDPLTSSYFVTGFEVFECEESMAIMEGVDALPADALEMEETLCEGFNELEVDANAASQVAPTATSPPPATAPVRSAAAQAAVAAAQAAAAAAANAAANAAPAVAAEATASTGARILRTVSSLLKKEPSVAKAETKTPQLQATSSLGAVTPFLSVKEETLSDMESASDVSRTASSVLHGTTVPASGVAPLSASDASPAPAASSNALPPPLDTVNEVENVARAAQTIEQDLTGFLGLDTLEGATDLPQLDDADATYGLLPGLQSSVSAYMVGSQLGVEAEANSGIAVKSFDLARSFSMQLGAGLETFGSQQGLERGMSNSFGQRSVSNATAGGGQLSRTGTLLQYDPANSPTNVNPFADPNSAAGSIPSGVVATNSFSRAASGGVMAPTRQGSFAPQPQNVQYQMQPYQPPQQQNNPRLPSVLGMGVQNNLANHPFANLYNQTNAFAGVAQRFPSILHTQLLPAAAFQHTYNEDAKARWNAQQAFDRAETLQQRTFSNVAADSNSQSQHYSQNTDMSQNSLDYNAQLSSSPGGNQYNASYPSQNTGSQESGMSDYEIPEVGAGVFAPSSNSPNFGINSPPTARSHAAPRMLDAASTVAAVNASSASSNAVQPNPASSVNIINSLAALTKILEAVSTALREPLTDFMRVIGTDDHTSKLAAFICAETQKQGLCSTRQNSSVSAAALYMALTLENKRPTQVDFCRKINLTEVTLRKVLNELASQWGNLVPQKYKPKLVPSSWPPRTQFTAKTDAVGGSTSSRPMRSMSSTLHAVHGDWRSSITPLVKTEPKTEPKGEEISAVPPPASSTVVETSPPAVAPVPQEQKPTQPLARAPSFLYAPVALAGNAAAGGSATITRAPSTLSTSASAASVRRSGATPPGYVVSSFTPAFSATAGADAQPVNPLRFHTPLSLTATGQPVQVAVRSRGGAGTKQASKKEKAAQIQAIIIGKPTQAQMYSGVKA